jgi:pilus assembly protein FimV
LWEKVEEMGRKLNPENPMFRGGAAGKRAAAVTEEPFIAPMAAAATEMVKVEPVGEFALAGAPSPAVEESALDFDLGTPSTSAAASFDFDLEKPSTPAGAPSEPTQDFGVGGDNLIDFEPSRPTTLIAESPATSDSTVNFELDTAVAAPAAEAGASAQWDETATKLDLAKAYIDMGDAEGARSILNEVMSEGNETQKKQARDLVAQIG